MDNNGPIGVIDSGIGGFTVLKALQDRLPNENYLYFGDSMRMPYGERENDELIMLANTIIRDLENRGVKAVVLACNTLSSLIVELSARVPLFSVIEAGVQETLNWRDRGLVGLIATTATVKNRGYEKELELWTREVEYIAQGTHTLAKVINDGQGDLKILKNNIREAVEPILLKGIKKGIVIEELLLGCTHFPIVAVTIRQMYPELELINPANGLVRQLNKHLAEFNYFNTQDEVGSTQILTTADYDIFERMIKELELDCDSLELTELKLP
ncbi:aspartate/glutamate racemase family protein [Acetobacterium wieringae]|nr:MULTISPECIES: aspartate/glutamate racemase family protein [Acetobacterium]MEA4804455.1 aspartate/glutamate racemase family protein [Acetobacterium wieringae]UYO63759.1 aspartate/glutamate racemase family protein [Acetobacterium wieringae]VUZ27376.1 Glutamate racemase [Acetobacterium wieringae]